MVIWSVVVHMVSIVVDGNIFIKHSVWSSTMPSIGARRAAPCVSAAVTPASVGSHHAGDIVAASCLEAEELSSKRRAVILSTITDVAKLHFFDREAVLCCLRTWIHYEDFALCSLRTCNRTLMEFLATVNSNSKDFIKSCLMQMRIHNRCPRLSTNWTLFQPHCSSPFCRGRTGLWVPWRRHNLPPPSVDSISGSMSIQSWVTEHSAPYVVCSMPCRARVKHLLKLRHETSHGLVVAVTDYVPARYVD